MRITQISVQQAIESLRSHADGLSSQEAGRRLAEYGPNRVEEIKGEHLLLRLAREFTHFFALILWIAAGLAFVAELNDPGKGMATLAYAIIGVIVINGAFSFWQEYRAGRAIAALKDLLPPHVTVLRDGIASRVPAEELVPGDMLLVREGDDIPADCRLIEAMGLRVNSATMTGESVPIALSAAPSDEIELLACRNVLLAGTAAVSGEGRAIVFATGMRTEFGRIAHLTQTGGADQSPLQREIARLSRLVALLATVVGVAFFFIGQLLGLSFWENFIFAIGIIVANVPEGLLPTVTLSLAMATQRMARRNALVRHLPAVEALGSATVILSDKTGTLTLNRMALHTVFLAERTLAFPLAERDAVAQHTPFFLIALHCNNLREVAQDGRTALLGDPMEAALRDAARAVLAPAREYPRFGELPFDADRKCMSSAHQTPYGQVLYCKGAPETVLPLCTSVWTRDGARPLDAAMRERFRLAQEAMAERGLRILLLSFRSLPIGCPQEQWESNLTLAGLAGIEDPPRPEVPPAIERCREAGIKVIMVTGDHPHTALAIGREIGMIRSMNPLVITGPELARMRETQIQLALDAEEILFARVSADQKMHIVEGLKRKGHVVAVTGDGVNDAPALKRADIGIAMGISGTDVARESADMVLLDDNFASIVSAIEEGRAVYANIRKFLTYILTSNIPELVPYLAFVAFKIPLPLTIIQILAVDLGTDMLPALALGAEKPDPDGMRRPPRDRYERLLSWPLLARAYLFLGLLGAATAMAAFFFVLRAGGWHYGEVLDKFDPLYLQATAACLAGIIVTQVVNVFLCRDERASSFAVGFARNRPIVLGVTVEVALVLGIVYTPWGQTVFGTAPFPAGAWLFLLPFAMAMFLLEEMRKLVARRLDAARR